MTVEGINRAPAGIPSGGQFVAHNHAEAPIRLFDRTDGSFLNPAPSATAEHCIQFWSTVRIPDEIIDQVVVAYAADRAQEIDEDMDQAMAQWRARWEEQNPAPKQRHLEEYQDRFKAEYEQHRQAILPGVVAKRPERLGEYDVPQLIRAAKMIRKRPSPERFPGQEDKVLDEPVELFHETLTVMEIESKYKLSRIKDSMDRIHRTDNKALLTALEVQSEQLSGIHTQLVHQRNDSGGY